MSAFESRTGVAVERILEPRSKRRRGTSSAALVLYTPVISCHSHVTQKLPNVEKENTSPEKKAENQASDDEIDKRKKALDELVSAERIYVNYLRSLKQVLTLSDMPVVTSLWQNYLVPLQKAAKEAKSKVSEEEVTTIFSCVEELYALHSDMFKELDYTLEVYPSASIAAIFNKRVSSPARILSNFPTARHPKV